MEMVSIIETRPADPAYPRTSTLVLEKDGSVTVIGVLPHGYQFRPTTAEDARKLATHLTPERADGQCG